MKIGRLPTPAPVMWICSPSLTRPIVLSSRIEKATLQLSSMHTHFTLMPRVKSMCCSPTGRRRPGTPCSSRIWLATGYSSLRAVPYPLHSLHESLCNGLLKRRSQTLRTTSSYGRIFRYADHVVNPLQTLATRIPVNHREMGCETRCS